MKKIWELTWGISINELNINEVDPDYYEDEYSADYTWSEDCFYKTYKFNDSHLFLFSCFDERTLRLGFYVESKNGTYEISNALELSEEWGDADNETRRTLTNFIDLRGKDKVDIEPFPKLAHDAITKLKIVP